MVNSNTVKLERIFRDFTIWRKLEEVNMLMEIGDPYSSVPSIIDIQQLSIINEKMEQGELLVKKPLNIERN